MEAIVIGIIFLVLVILCASVMGWMWACGDKEREAIRDSLKMENRFRGYPTLKWLEEERERLARQVEENLREQQREFKRTRRREDKP